MSTPTPPHITARAVARVAAGETASRVAADLGVSVHTVLRAARAKGAPVAPRGRPRDPRVREALALAAAEGLTLAAAAGRLGVSATAVYAANGRRAWEGRR